MLSTILGIVILAGVAYYFIDLLLRVAYPVKPPAPFVEELNVVAPVGALVDQAPFPYSSFR